MRKMREIDGYMTLEASLIIPVLCFLLVLLFSFFFYIMDLGIVSGLVKVQAEIGVPAAGSVEIFGLRLFKITEQQEFMLPKETEKIRRWSLIE